MTVAYVTLYDVEFSPTGADLCVREIEFQIGLSSGRSGTDVDWATMRPFMVGNLTVTRELLCQMVGEAAVKAAEDDACTEFRENGAGGVTMDWMEAAE